MVAQDDKFRVLRKLPEVRFEEELRGYSKSQVDRVLQGLAPLADDVAVLQQRLAETEGRAAAAEARLLERHVAAPVVSELAAAGQATVAAPMPVPPASFDETLSKTLLLAQRTADQAVAEARTEAAALVKSARDEAEQLKAENARARDEAASSVAEERQALLDAAHRDVQAKVEAAEASLSEAEGAQREQLVAEIAEYTELRDALGEDIERLEGHLAQRRDTIRAALADISAVVDDPARLHSEMPPVASMAIETPSPRSASIALDVDGVDDLVADRPDTAISETAPFDAGPFDDAPFDTTPFDTTPSDDAETSRGSAVDADTRASLLGELDGQAGEPTAAVAMVRLLKDDDEADATLVGDQPSDVSRTSEATPSTAAAQQLNETLAAHAPAAREPGLSSKAQQSETDAMADIDADEADLDLEDWGSASASTMESGAVIVDEVRWDDASTTGASPADFGFEDATDHVPSGPTGGARPSGDHGRRPAERKHGSDEVGRPAWAEAIPDIDQPQVLTKSDDPFLDELRRATGDGAETDVALERFLSDDAAAEDDDRRSGWFNRRK